MGAPGREGEDEPYRGCRGSQAIGRNDPSAPGSKGTIERSVAMASVGGAQVLGPSDFPLEDSERAVLVRSGGEEPVAWGCWSTAKADADRLMGDIFSLANGVPLA